MHIYIYVYTYVYIHISVNTSPFEAIQTIAYVSLTSSSKREPGPLYSLDGERGFEATWLICILRDSA